MAGKLIEHIDTDVYTEAKKRIHHVLDTFDSFAVCFSGGKDSLTTLHLVKECLIERGESPGNPRGGPPINVIFRDEELIPESVIEFVQKYARDPRYKVYYYAVQLKSEKFILGKKFEYVQWDNNRKWIRPKPDNAITEPVEKVFDQYSMDAECSKNFKGKIAFFNGIRADESLIRLRSVVNKKNECYVSGTAIPSVKFVKPIYDWSEKDIFKYLYDNDIRYCPIYDAQLWNGQALRVATPLHAECAKRFDKLRTLYPVFYEQLIDIFPEMLVQERYWKEFDRYAVIKRYPNTWAGLISYIKTEIDDPAMQKMAFKRAIESKKIRDNTLKAGKGQHNFGGYPLLYVFKQILAGNYKRVIQPTSHPTKQEMEYEQ